MRAPISRRACLATSVASAALLLAGCNQSPQTSIDLLRAGNPAICTATDVEETVRQLIRPKGVATDAYTISFADASLEAFDKVVSRATCNVALTIDGPNGSVVERTMIDFTVSPAAQDPSSFLVSGALAPFTQRFADAISDAAVARQEEDGERQTREALVALVKPGWLIGRWVMANQGSSACNEGSYDDYARGGVISSVGVTGHWQLDGQKLTVTLPDRSGAATITDATMNEFTMQEENGDEHRMRRCLANEIDVVAPPPAPDPGSDEPDAAHTDEPAPQ